jgi:DNA-binding GntR family transcriptional regulator
MPQRSARLRDQVYAAVRAMLRDGTYPENRLAEEQLALQLQVSRTPVREALFQLCREGVLEDTGRGYRRPELTVQDVREIVELRRLLEPAMARTVAAEASEAVRSDFRSIVGQEEAAARSSDPAPFIQANAAFRQLFLTACGNRRIEQIMQMFDDQIAQLRQVTLRPVENRLATLASHGRFLTALGTKDGEMAADAMLELLNAASLYYDTIWRPNGVPAR